MIISIYQLLRIGLKVINKIITSLYKDPIDQEVLKAKIRVIINFVFKIKALYL